MGSHGIKDRVAIVGMGCTRFAEHWDKSLDDLLIEATDETFAATGVTGGALVRQPWDSDGQTMTETLLIAPGKVQRIVEAIVGQEWSPPSDGAGADDPS